ncbi:MAG: hypothetical protein AMJ89_03570 [candidate division Zixibacteria bacterium SM23_73]|nr:MAG: hypothetical protein AMJ89_03570 [candidate division Zixibacteria bacterium SM23_73]
MVTIGGYPAYALGISLTPFLLLSPAFGGMEMGRGGEVKTQSYHVSGRKPSMKSIDTTLFFVSLS